MPVMPLQTPHSANLRNHRKIAIFDHQIAAVGGRNLALEYMGPTPNKRRWRDIGGVIEGPAVRLLDEIFLADWAHASGQSLAELQKELPAELPAPAGDSEVQIVVSGPDAAGDAIRFLGTVRWCDFGAFGERGRERAERQLRIGNRITEEWVDVRSSQHDGEATVELEVGMKAEHDLVLTVIGPGGIVGAMDALDGDPRSASAVPRAHAGPNSTGKRSACDCR